MIKVYVAPGDAWGFYQKNKTALQNASAVLVETASGDTQICLTDIGGPVLEIYMDDAPEPVTSEPILDPDDMEITIEWFSQKYLDGFLPAPDDEPPSYAPVRASTARPAAQPPDPARTPANPSPTVGASTARPAAQSHDPAKTPATTHPLVGAADPSGPSRSAAAHTPDTARTPATTHLTADDDDFDLFWNACHSTLTVTPGIEEAVQDVIDIRRDDLLQAARGFLAVVLDRDDDIMDEEYGSDLAEMVLQNVLQDVYDITGLSPWYPTIDGSTLVPYPTF